MTYFGDHNVAPSPNAADEAFWTNCRQRRLTFQQCAACGTLTHPPIGVCPHCQSLDRQWIEAPATARVFSFTWIHTATHPASTHRLPYNVAVVTFDDLPGVRLITNIIDAEPGCLAVGDCVELAWEAIGDDFVLPRFRLAGQVMSQAAGNDRSRSARHDDRKA